jgi:hypothetical protein
LVLRNDRRVSDFVHPNNNLKARDLRAFFVLRAENEPWMSLNFAIAKSL